MESIKAKKVLVSGASIAGLSAAWWMNSLGYKVTVIERAPALRTAGGAVNIEGTAIDAVRRMGILEQLKANRLQVETIEFKNAEDITESAMQMIQEGEAPSDDEIEIERDKLLYTLYDKLKGEVEFIFNSSVTALQETGSDIQATFKSGAQYSYDLVLGCDGSHSGIRKIWFGSEDRYTHYLGAYFSITIVDELLIKQKSMQMYNEPDKAIMLNAYNHKTDIIFCFNADQEIPYHYRDEQQQRKIILQQFEGGGWRTAELLELVMKSPMFYFDKFCQIKMPSWTKGRVVLIGDAAYCPSPAAGKGGSMAIEGATALADALQNHAGDFKAAFRDYDQNLRPSIEEAQAMAEQNVKENFIPRTEEAIRKRNTEGFSNM